MEEGVLWETAFIIRSGQGCVCTAVTFIPFKASCTISSDQTLLQWTWELSPGSGDYFIRFYSWRFSCASNEMTISVCIRIPRPIHEADLSAVSWDVPILHLSCFIKRQISTWTPLNDVFDVYDSRGAWELTCPLVEWLIKKMRNCPPVLSAFTFKNQNQSTQIFPKSSVQVDLMPLNISKKLSGGGSHELQCLHSHC